MDSHAQQKDVASETSHTSTNATSDLLARRVTINLAGVSRKRAIDAASQSAKVRIQYREQLFERFVRLVNVHVNNMALGDVLAQLLDGTGLRVIADGQMQLVITDAETSVADSTLGGIAGQVVDSATGHGLENATVRLDGTRLSTTTKSDGVFRFANVPPAEYVLNIRRMGYHSITQRLVVSGGRSANTKVVMAAVANVLSGVVTTATGVQRKIEVGNDITAINADSVMKAAPVTSVSEMLEGRVPGLTVIRTSGTPGDPSRLRLRGAASIYGSNDPIVIIDGVRAYYGDNSTSAAKPGKNAPAAAGDEGYPRPSPLDQLDPNIVETIDVFKGPSASALYGSDAANGVIVITTKHGHAGPTRWSLGARSGWTQIPGTYPTYTYEFGHTAAGGVGDDQPCVLNMEQPVYINTACTVDTSIAFQALNNARYSPFATGRTNDLTGSVSGGVPSLQYMLSGSASTDLGVIQLPGEVSEQYLQFSGKAVPSWMRRPDNYTTYSGSASVVATVSSSMLVTISSRSGASAQQRSSLGLSGVGQLIGTFIDTTQLGKSPLLTKFMEKATSDTKSSTNTAQWDWQATSWTKLSATGGVDQQHGRDVIYQPSGLPAQFLVDSTGSYSLGQRDASTITGNLVSVSQIPLVGDKKIRLALGFNAQNTSSATSTIAATGIPVGISDPSSFPFLTTSAGQSTAAQATYGWYVEPQIDLSSRFFFSPGFRLDGGSGTGTRSNLTGLPKMSVAWVALDHDESDTHPWRKLIDQLRFRGSYGYAAVQPSPQDRLRLIAQTNVVVNGVLMQGAFPASYGNTKIHPERSVEFESGFDLSSLDDRITLTATYYRKKRIDAIMSTILAPSVLSSGSVDTYQQNVGNIRNDGLEFTAGVRLVRNPMFQWDANVSTSVNTNKLLTLSSSYNPSPGGANAKLVVGYPIDGIWVRPLAGYTDLNGDHIIERNEVVSSDSLSYIGTQNPPKSGAVGTTISTLNGRLSVTADLTYQYGLTQYNDNGLISLQSLAVQPNATLEQQAIYVSTVTQSNYEYSRYLYQTTNTWRWNSASVRWILPTTVSRGFRVQSMALSLQGSNLWIHTNYQGKDPDVNTATRGEGVADFGQVPNPRGLVVRLDLTN
jgi:TonB-linked SusC/RagA family outer membrane protein